LKTGPEPISGHNIWKHIVPISGGTNRNQRVDTYLKKDGPRFLAITGSDIYVTTRPLKKKKLLTDI